MSAAASLDRGREAFGRHAWAEAHAQLSATDAQLLEAEDLVRLAMSAYLMGRDSESVDILGRAYHELLDRGDVAQAVRCTFWVGFQLINKGDIAQAGGWFARGRRLLDENQLDCVEQGYLLVPLALQSLFGGDFPVAHEAFVRAAEIGERFGDPDLITLARLGRGQALIGMGDTAAGVALLDEVMVGVTTGEVSAVVSGLVYCAVISACQDVFDLHRAREWTEALTRWCASQPDLIPYRGQCLVHRAQIMQLRGAWRDATAEAEQAREQLSKAPDQASIGMAFYELGELHRLRGEFAPAEDAYREASQWGHAPQPGLSRLRLAQGRIDAAEASIRLALDEAQTPVTRAKVLPTFVETMILTGDVGAARAAAEELTRLAGQFGAPFLRAVAAHAEGSVLTAEGDALSALAALRRAHKAWQDLEAPYEAARVRAGIALACRELGDFDTAALELEAARRVFEQLGAAPDLARVEDLSGTASSNAPGGLTGREVEVLALVATGKSNREIASELVISEKTVARHLSNIFIKLGVSSRAGATAYAYKHDLA